MNHFQYRDGELYCEDVPLSELVSRHGTPLYVYSYATFERHFRVFDGAFAEVPHITCYAVKANSSQALLSLVNSWGGGMDVVSGGELFRALSAGAKPEKIVYAGVGKTVEEIEKALQAGILMFNVESLEELVRIDATAARLGLRAPVAIRVNPAIDPMTHKYIATGLRESKFGIEAESVVETYRDALSMQHVEVVGVHAHIGSQITQTGPFREAMEKLSDIIRQVRELGADLRYINIGGGLGITYHEEEPPAPDAFAAELLPFFKDWGCTIVTEPGRVIVGNAGSLITRALYRKESGVKKFLVVDAGMNDLMRPSLYGSYHGIRPLRQREASAAREKMDVVGPICESGDFLAKGRELPDISPGEYLEVGSAGAYGFTMASNYNSRPRPAEILVQGTSHFVIRERETNEDLIRGEKIPSSLLEPGGTPPRSE
jgi:diaminopimelate decarboxylase